MTQQVRDQEHAPGFLVTVTGRHLPVTESIRRHILAKIAKLDRLSDRVIDVAVTLDVQRELHRVDVLLKLGHICVKSQAESDDMYASVDLAVSRLHNQVRRYKKRIQDHHIQSLKTVDMMVNVLGVYGSDELSDVNDAIDEQSQQQLEERYRTHPQVAKEKVSLKTLSLDNAVMRMELEGHAFLVFTNEQTGRINIIHRRGDGHFGVMDPQAS